MKTTVKRPTIFFTGFLVFSFYSLCFADFSFSSTVAKGKTVLKDGKITLQGNEQNLKLKIRANQDYMSINVKDAEFRQILYSISRQAGVGFSADAPKEFMDKKVSISLQNVSLEKGVNLLAQKAGIKHVNMIYTRLVFHGKPVFLLDKVEFFYNVIEELVKPKSERKPGRIREPKPLLFRISPYLPAVLRTKYLPPPQPFSQPSSGNVGNKEGSLPPPEILKKREEYKKRMMEEAEKKKNEK